MNINLLLLIAIVTLSPFNAIRAARANPTQEELALWRKRVAQNQYIGVSEEKILAHHDSWKAKFFSVDDNGYSIFDKVAGDPLYKALACFSIGLLAGHPASRAITKFDHKLPLVLPNLRAVSLAGVGAFTALNGLDSFWWHKHERTKKIIQLMMGGMAIGSGACLLKLKNN